MSGVWLTSGLRRSEPPHSCAKPFEPFQVDDDQTDLPFGAVWRCDDCGRGPDEAAMVERRRIAAMLAACVSA